MVILFDSIPKNHIPKVAGIREDWEPVTGLSNTGGAGYFFGLGPGKGYVMEKVQIGTSTLEDVMSGVETIEDYMTVIRGICELDVNSSMQGYALLDAIKVSLNIPVSQLKDILKVLKEVYPEGGAS